jgi:hypothetical protein
MGNEDGLPVRGEIFPVYIVCVWGGGGGGGPPSIPINGRTNSLWRIGAIAISTSTHPFVMIC